MLADIAPFAAALLSVQTTAVPNAQETAQTDPQSDIIVTAPKDAPTKLERQKELRDMVTDIFRKPREGRTVGTFFEAICPNIVGLPDNAAKVIKARIEENAARLGANRRDPSTPCVPNVLVKFIPPDKGAPKEWLTYDSDELDHLLSYQRMWVLNEEGPVRAWNKIQIRSADGIPIPERSYGRFQQAQNRLRSTSRLRNPTTTEIRSAVVLIELVSANGKTLQQLADYATMRALASTGEIDTESALAADTILTLFQDGDAPEGLTTFDQAVITGLYQKSRNTQAKKYYSGIAATAVAMELDEEQPSAQ